MSLKLSIFLFIKKVNKIHFKLLQFKHDYSLIINPIKKKKRCHKYGAFHAWKIKIIQKKISGKCYNKNLQQLCKLNEKDVSLCKDLERGLCIQISQRFRSLSNRFIEFSYNFWIKFAFLNVSVTIYATLKVISNTFFY